MTIRNTTFFTAVLCGLCSLRAQTGSPLIFTVNQAAENRAVTVGVKNVSAGTVAAFAFSYPTPTAPASRIRNPKTIMFCDPLLRVAEPIPPGQELTVPFARGASTADIQLHAVLFADGTTWGDPVWAQRILTRRRNAVQDIVRTLVDLTSAQARGTSREDLISQFESSMSLERQTTDRSDPLVVVPNSRSPVLHDLRLVHPNGAPNPVNGVVKAQIKYLTSQLAALQAATQ